ncbi:hypothetical protein RJ640_022707 [Escallonia rubra]|uniref:Uncharacterized protein n=1 Tax=Escallonia rubra TaxID=112253 RepID=A0AA88RTQ9_9ASTE|nr:hypothetical protein RJ640_022707 [Escallonia rubra]
MMRAGTSRRVDGDVEGLDAVDGVGGRRSFEVEHAEEAAVHGAVAAAGGVDHGGDQCKGNARLPWKRERRRRFFHEKCTTKVAEKVCFDGTKEQELKEQVIQLAIVGRESYV